jgi:hypothetical protein
MTAAHSPTSRPGPTRPDRPMRRLPRDAGPGSSALLQRILSLAAAPSLAAADPRPAPHAASGSPAHGGGGGPT